MSLVYTPIVTFIKRLGLTLTRTRNVDPGIRLAIARQHILTKFEISLVLDIGANRGQWAVEALANGYANELISFEPTSKAFKVLENNVSSIPKWKAINAALGTNETTPIMHVSANEELSSSFLEMGNEHKIAAPHANYVGTEVVRILEINPFIPKDSKVFLKIDTQGYELVILNSISPDQWQQIRALEIEVSFVQAYLGGPLAEEVIVFLRSKGFHPYRIENGLARSGFGQQIQADILFVRTEFSGFLD